MTFTDQHIEEQAMDGILFLVLWIGGAALHTLFELKIKSKLRTSENTADNRTYWG